MRPARLQQFVERHSRALQTASWLIPNVTWVLPERFARSEVPIEILNSISGLISVCLERLSGERSASACALALSSLHQMEVLLEMAAVRLAARGAIRSKYSLLLALELLKALLRSRLLLHDDPGTGMLLEGGLLHPDDKQVPVETRLAASYQVLRQAAIAASALLHTLGPRAASSPHGAAPGQPPQSHPHSTPPVAGPSVPPCHKPRFWWQPAERDGCGAEACASCSTKSSGGCEGLDRPPLEPPCKSRAAVAWWSCFERGPASREVDSGGEAVANELTDNLAHRVRLGTTAAHYPGGEAWSSVSAQGLGRSGPSACSPSAGPLPPREPPGGCKRAQNGAAHAQGAPQKAAGWGEAGAGVSGDQCVGCVAGGGCGHRGGGRGGMGLPDQACPQEESRGGGSSCWLCRVTAAAAAAAATERRLAWHERCVAAGEWLALARPVVYVGLLWRLNGRRDVRPWLAALLCDVCGLVLTRRGLCDMQQTRQSKLTPPSPMLQSTGWVVLDYLLRWQLGETERLETRRRQSLLWWYLLRDPVFSHGVRPMLRLAQGAASKLPLMGAAYTLCLELLEGAQQYYVYTSAS